MNDDDSLRAALTDLLAHWDSYGTEETFFDVPAAMLRAVLNGQDPAYYGDDDEDDA